jgi:elongation factor Ts
MASIDQIKQLRRETAVSVSECKKALEEVGGNIEKAKEILKQWGKDLAGKKAGRGTEQGIISSYIHPNKKIGVLLKLGCETDFVAKSSEFQELAHELCLQIAAIGEEPPLLEQPWVKDQGKTVKDLVEEYVAKIGENITIKQFTRYEI